MLILQVNTGLVKSDFVIKIYFFFKTYGICNDCISNDLLVQRTIIALHCVQAKLLAKGLVKQFTTNCK